MKRTMQKGFTLIELMIVVVFFFKQKTAYELTR